LHPKAPASWVAIDHDEKIIGETADPQGARVVLLARIWHDKVLLEHIELRPFMDSVLRTVRSAEHIEVDPVYTMRKRYFARGLGPSRWLLAVVSYEQVPARIISAFAHRKDPPTWDA
jgi:hypothetical protein